MAVPLSGGRRPAAGFTLVELLIAFTLLIVLAAMLAPILVPSPGRQMRDTAGEIAATLREARRVAQQEQRRTRFVLDTGARRFGIEGHASWRSYPAAVAISLTTAESLLVDAASGAVEFFADGSSSGGRVELAADGGTRRIDIEWLTGRVRLDGSTP